MRRHLEWLLRLCFMWHVMKINKTHGELLSKETAFQLQKYPAVSREKGEVIKNFPKMCYNIEAHDEGTATANEYSYENSSSDSREILQIFKTILQQIHRKECEQIEGKQEQDLHETNLPLYVAKERKIQNEESFSILEQLKLDEQQEKWQQQQQQLKLHLQEQQNALKLQQIMQKLEGEGLDKANKKKKKKRKRRKKRKKKKPVKDKKKKRKKKPIKQEASLLAHPAHILFASPTQKPQHFYHGHNDNHHYQQISTTTPKPSVQLPLLPIKKIKYILRKNTIFKKKKKEYLNHLKHVLYPFVKFIAFFTIINPFTLAVFLFSLISPIVFGFLGFIGLSFFIKPALYLLFGVKQTVNAIKRQKLRALRRRQRLRDSRRPITIHKHYYQQRPIVPHQRYHPPPKPKGHHHNHHHSQRLRNRPRPHHHHRQHYHPQLTKPLNPLLPAVRQKFKQDTHFIPDFKDYNDDFEEI